MRKGVGKEVQGVRQAVKQEEPTGDQAALAPHSTKEVRSCCSVTRMETGAL